MRTVGNFKEWAYEKAREFDEFKKNHGYLCCGYYNRNTVLVNLKNGKTWVAVCHKLDDFDINIGKGVAFARYLGEEIPIEHKEVNLSSLRYGDRFSIYSSNYTYTFIAQEPISQRYIYINEKTKGICYSPRDMRVYTV